MSQHDLDYLIIIPSTAHILGGAVIGSGPDNGVVDRDHQVFGYQGLYVCDGSVVPANVGVNPSLTITALTEHAMSRIPARDPDTPRENRTLATGVKGPRANRYTMGARRPAS